MRCFPKLARQIFERPLPNPGAVGCHRFLGDLSEEDPPVPIPNTEVKLLSPDGTAQATVWESRKSPGLNHKSPVKTGLFLFWARAECGGAPLWHAASILNLLPA